MARWWGSRTFALAIVLVVLGRLAVPGGAVRISTGGRAEAHAHSAHHYARIASPRAGDAGRAGRTAAAATAMIMPRPVADVTPDVTVTFVEPAAEPPSIAHAPLAPGRARAPPGA